MPRVKLPTLDTPRLPPSERVLEKVLSILDAVELDPELVPEHWLDMDGPSFAIYVEGGERPSWSPRQAGKIASSALQLLQMRRELNTLARAQGYPAVVSMPMFLKVMVCDRCLELKLGSSRAERRVDECDVCAIQCREYDKHKSNQINCDQCRSVLRTLWTSQDPIPGDWLI